MQLQSNHETLKITTENHSFFFFFTKKRKKIEPEHVPSTELDKKHQELEIEKVQMCASATESEPNKQTDIDPGPSTSQVHHHER